MTHMMTESGRTHELPAPLLRSSPEYPGQLTRHAVAGLDPDGRIVVDQFDARNGKGTFLFGLTLCCNATDKGTEHGVVCRGCRTGRDTGNYLYRAADGSFPGLDPIVCIFED